MSAKKQLRKAKLIKWSALIKEQSESGLNVRAWCAQNDISKDSFYYWRRRVKEELIDSITPDIIPVLPITPSTDAVDTTPVYDSPTAIAPDVSHNLYKSSNAAEQSVSSNLYNLPNTYDNSKTITISSNDIHIVLPISTDTTLITGIIEVLCHA